MPITHQMEAVKPSIRRISTGELRQMLEEFERKYGMSSEEFSRKTGQGGLCETDDFIDWLGLYEIYLKKQNERRQILYDHPQHCDVTLGDHTG